MPRSYAPALGRPRFGTKDAEAGSFRAEASGGVRSTERARAGAASVEYLALAGLIGLLVIAGIAALVASQPRRADRELGEMLARRIACAPRYPVPCGRNPLALAYGFPLGKLVRSLAPAPAARAGELPVDFRYCRQPSCAAPGPDRGLTASGRRVTEFTSVEDLRRSGGPVHVTYWLYRPGLPWERIVRTAWAPQIEAASSIRLNLEDDPGLVPLETLPGRDHYLFPPGEEPPWRWSIASRPSGRPFG
jgi:hypothetical protein